MHAFIEGHTFKRFDGELSHLHVLVLEMGRFVNTQLTDALLAFKNRNLELAQEVIDRDIHIDNLEVDADAEILKVIARHCPVGSDLRVVIAVSKCVSDLEKIGDEAVRIASLMAQMTVGSAGHLTPELIVDIDHIGNMALSNYQSAIELFDVWDEAKAHRVIDGHRQMDGEFQSELQRLMTYLMEETIEMGLAVNLVLVAKSLDRITHHALNLSEYAMFEIKGIDVRLAQP